MSDFTIKSEMVRMVQIKGVRDTYITIPDATAVIRQKFPGYKSENLYMAALSLDREGNHKIKTVLYQPEFGQPRRLIPLAEFERWLERDDLGSMSKPRNRRRRR
jgi:hypothetical protein